MRFCLCGVIFYPLKSRKFGANCYIFLPQIRLQLNYYEKNKNREKSVDFFLGIC